MLPNRRTFRVKELLKHEIAECLRREFTIDEVGLLTVNDVGIASDLRSATVFIGFVGTTEQRQLAPVRLAARTKDLQMRVGAAVRLKFTPTLRFQIDDSIEQGNRVVALLDELEKPPPRSPQP